ncbi:hypothetical protein BCR42DRAFT_402697 [Absidia repens]|uniref:Uncharacterized protein n=1 Tax=Absidia repens TaxID=90262 RepID=A0A1X2IYE2_9FUNG|nr:hypothetical protein BCR42DRAFT_402697 [Absidia repens]
MKVSKQTNKNKIPIHSSFMHEGLWTCISFFFVTCLYRSVISSIMVRIISILKTQQWPASHRDACDSIAKSHISTVAPIFLDRYCIVNWSTGMHHYRPLHQAIFRCI